MSQNLRRTIVIEGVRYHDDRPKSCEDAEADYSDGDDNDFEDNELV